VRVSLLVAACLVACSSPASEEAPVPSTSAGAPVTPAPSPPPPASSSPAPRGLRVEVDASTLIVRDGAVEAREPLPEGAGVALIDLATGGAERGVWIGTTTGSSSLRRLRADGTLETLYAAGPAYASHGIAGHSTSGAMLADLDGDGRYEIVLTTTRFDDTGSHARREVLARDAEGGAFTPRTGLRAPPANALFTGDRDPITRAVSANVLGTIALGVDVVVPVTAPPGYGGLGPGPASPPSILDTLALVAFPEPRDTSDGPLTLSLHVVRAWPAPVRVLASAPIGELSEAFTDDACRVRVRTGVPLLRAATLAGGEHLLVATHATGAARTVRSFSWYGAALAPRMPPTELDRCDTPARDVPIDRADAADSALRPPEPLPAGRDRLW
jgi:hypothetical protein